MSHCGLVRPTPQTMLIMHSSKRHSLTSLTSLFKALDVSYQGAEVELLPMHRSSVGRMTLLPPPVIRVGTGRS